VILTVTLNPALDLTYRVEALVPHGTHRVGAVAERAGGKGLNVARVLHLLGVPVRATGLLGGGVGGRVRSLLTADGVDASFLRIANETRRTVAVADGVDATGFWEPGPVVTGAEWSGFVAHFRSLLGDAEVVALSGSLPPGVPADGYAVLIRLAAAAGARTILDTSGEALRAGLAAGPDLAKPNATELAALLAVSPVAVPTGTTTRSAGFVQAEGARTLGARAVVVSHGPRGLVAASAHGAWRSRPVAAVTGNPTGAGDACVAALARGLRAGTAWPGMLADAVALSAAAVAAPVAGAVDLDEYRRIQRHVITEEL
jgi:tagatose 6-phosphate kinase